MLRRLFIILVCWVIKTAAFTQLINGYNFVRYTTINGLSDNEISGITQDERGFVWISTANGLTRFDGQEMQAIYQQPYASGLISNDIYGMRVNGNKLLVYSFNGAQLIDINNNAFKQLLVSTGKPSSAFENNVYDATIIHKGLYALSTYAGFYVFNDSAKIIFRYDFFKPEAIASVQKQKGYGRNIIALNNFCVLQFDAARQMHIYDSRLNRFLSDKEFAKNYSHLYALQGNALNLGQRYDNNNIIFNYAITSQIILYNPATDSVRAQEIPATIQKFIGWNSRWLALNDTLAMIFGSRGGLHIAHINEPGGMPMIEEQTHFAAYNCNAAMLDKDNRLWVGTDNGLFQQDNAENNIHTIDLLQYIAKKDAVKYETFSLFTKDKELFIGSYSYLPILVLDAETYRVKKTISFEKLSPKCNQVWQIIQYNKDTLWFATQGGIVWYNCTNGRFNKVNIPALHILDDAPITLCYKDSYGLIWLQGFWGRGITVFNPARQTTKHYSVTDRQNYMPLRVANFITEDAHSNIWLAEEGLTCWNRQSQAFDTLITRYAGFNKDNSKITSLSNTDKGDLIFCNAYNGVLLYNPVKKMYTQLSAENALEENAALAVCGLGNGYIWVQTRNSITGYNLPATRAIKYSYKDGLPLMHTNGVILHDSDRKRMLFAYDNYLAWTADSIKKKYSSCSNFIIDKISFTGNRNYYFPGDETRFAYNQNDIAIHFSAINFTDPGNNRFEWRMNNQPAWVTLGSENNIHFNQLAPGKYLVQVRYRAGSSPVNGYIKNILLIIQPPFWRTAWFIITVAIVILLSCYVYYRRRLQEVRRIGNLDKQLVQMEMKALQSQMNPHFIFNCLNSIKEMILHHENNAASRYLSQFAKLIRLSLEQSYSTFISLHATIDYLRQYVEMEKIRNGCFSCVFEKKGVMDDQQVMLIPTFIQPVIENAIWHARPGNGNALTIKVCFTKQEDMLVCTVDDNGIGILQSQQNKKQTRPSHVSMGIRNIIHRIQLLNEKYSFATSISVTDKSTIPSETGTGTLVTILFPLKTMHNE